MTEPSRVNVLVTNPITLFISEKQMYIKVNHWPEDVIL
jgi:hypothetical protein